MLHFVTGKAGLVEGVSIGFRAVLRELFSVLAIMFECWNDWVPYEWIGEKCVLASLSESGYIPHCGVLLHSHRLRIFLEVVQTIEHQELTVQLVPRAIHLSNVCLALSWVNIDAELELLLLLILVIFGSSELRAWHLNLTSPSLDLSLMALSVLGKFWIDSLVLLISALGRTPQNTIPICQSEVGHIERRTRLHEWVACSSQSSDFTTGLQWSCRQSHHLLHVHQFDVYLRRGGLWWNRLCLECFLAGSRLVRHYGLHLPRSTEFARVLNNSIDLLELVFDFLARPQWLKVGLVVRGILHWNWLFSISLWAYVACVVDSTIDCIQLWVLVAYVLIIYTDWNSTNIQRPVITIIFMIILGQHSSISIALIFVFFRAVQLR